MYALVSSVLLLELVHVNCNEWHHHPPSKCDHIPEPIPSRAVGAIATRVVLLAAQKCLC